MPIYEYQCSTCGDVIEALQRLSDPPLQTCGEHCACGDGAGAVQRVLSVTNISGGARSEGAFSAGADPAMCGSCGRAPGSCAYD